MAFDPDFAEMRFGYGLSPVVRPPRSAAAMLEAAAGPDFIGARFAIEPFDTFRARVVESKRLMKIIRKNRGTELGEATNKERRLLQKAARQDMWRWMMQTMLRRTYTQAAFFERLVAFWGDHFAARGKAGVMRRATSPYLEDGIRPFVMGRFSDLLKSAVMHPVMLQYLDQDRSMGPNSRRVQQQGGNLGLNENLAREVLELHTLGVDGPYSQTDVTQLAELLAGLTFQARHGFKFRKDFVEPGAETILGKAYADAMTLAPVHDALDDLAVHPATASHIARKLAVHFVSDAPSEDLVADLRARFQQTDGDLSAVYAVLLEHPASWQPVRANIKTPEEFVSGALRALAVSPGALEGLRERDVRNGFVTPMAVMGQVWQRFDGPDGWPEEDDAWVSPAGLAGRVQWAMGVPRQLVPDLPDPRDFVQTALGARASKEVIFAASAAESRPEAIGLVLMSPAFQRR